MPIPLLVVPLAVAAVTLATTVAVKLIGRRENTTPAKQVVRKVAILGGQVVGKTTLLRFLEKGELPGEVARTEDPSPGGEFALEVNATQILFNVPEDVPGNAGLQFKDWERAVQGADYVWYLFRADRVASGDKPTEELIRRHALQLRQWLDAAGNSRPKVILIGTHADPDPDHPKRRWEIADYAGNSVVIQITKVQLDADTVVGSMRTTAEAQQLVARLVGYLG